MSTKLDKQVSGLDSSFKKPVSHLLLDCHTKPRNESPTFSILRTTRFSTVEQCNSYSRILPNWGRIGRIGMTLIATSSLTATHQHISLRLLLACSRGACRKLSQSAALSHAACPAQPAPRLAMARYLPFSFYVYVVSKSAFQV